jgi:hypothetical protein
VRGIDFFGSKFWDIRTHLVDKLVSNNSVAQSPHEQSRALDLDTILNVQQRLVGFEVRLAVAVVIAYDMSAYDFYSLVPSSQSYWEFKNSQGSLRPCLEYSST